VGVFSQTTIIVLLFSCSPSAVIGRVSFVVVYALYGKFVWALSHVSEEIDEGLSPSLTNCDPATTVVRVTIIVRIVAAIFHVLPAVPSARLA
jgi:hypothetical protein